MNYVDGLAMFHKQHGTNYSRLPSVDKRPLDLYKLKKAVESRGGFESVCKTKKWAEIGRDLGYSGKIMSSLSTSLKNSYQRYLQPYEEYLARAKPGVQQQLELEHGGPYTPSPLPSPMNMMQKPMSEDNGTPSKTRDETPGLPRMAASHTPMAHTPMAHTPISHTPIAHTPVEKSPEKLTPTVESGPRPAAPGFTSVNNVGLGGFTAVNRSPFNLVNNGPPIKREGENGVSGPQVDPEQPLISTPVNGEKEEPLKRSISHDESSLADNGDDEDGENGRRSKRLKRGTILPFDSK
jgi:histone demethylase JARID1